MSMSQQLLKTRWGQLQGPSASAWILLQGSNAANSELPNIHLPLTHLHSIACSSDFDRGRTLTSCAWTCIGVSEAEKSKPAF